MRKLQRIIMGWDVSILEKDSKQHGVEPIDGSLVINNDNLEVPNQGREEILDVTEIKFRILGRLPNSPRSGELKETKRVNRYLRYQEKRILSCLKDKNYDKAFLI